MQTNGINLTPEIFIKSVKLDTEIYQKLSGILINDCLKTNFNKSTHFEDTRAHRQYFNKEFLDLNSKVPEKILENKKLFLTLFDSINEERIYYRNVLATLLEKSFWKLKIGKNNSDFFLSKIEGLKKELMLKRIEKLEQNENYLKESLKNRNLRIKELENEKKILKNDLTEKRLDFKNYILNREEKIDSPKKTKRKILANGRSLLLKSCVNVKNDFFKKEEDINLENKNEEISLNYSKENINLNYSEEKKVEIYAKKTRKILKRSKASCKSLIKSGVSQKKVKFKIQPKMKSEKKGFLNSGSKIKKRKLKKIKHSKTQSNNLGVIDSKNGFLGFEVNASDFDLNNVNDIYTTKKINRYQNNF